MVMSKTVIYLSMGLEHAFDWTLIKNTEGEYASVSIGDGA